MRDLGQRRRLRGQHRGHRAAARCCSANIPIVSALGYSAAIVVWSRCCWRSRCCPAVLAILGTRIESLQVPVPQASSSTTTARTAGARWARGGRPAPGLAALAAVAILLVLALPVLDLEPRPAGQRPVPEVDDPIAPVLRPDQGGLRRRAVNGPLLIAVRMRPPAHNDQQKLDQLNQQQQQQQQEQQVTRQTARGGGRPPRGPAGGRAAGEARGEREAAAAARSSRSSTSKSPASDPRLVKLENQIAKTKGVTSVSQADVSKQGRRRVHGDLEDRPVRARRPRSVVLQAARPRRSRTRSRGPRRRPTWAAQTAGYIDLADRIGDKLALGDRDRRPALASFC